MRVLYKTIMGSRLYGTFHDNSDYDYFTVVDRVKTRRAKFAKQTIVDGVDSVVVDFGTFTNLIQKGVPQSLEACFSQQAIYDDISAWRHSVRASSSTWDRYLRTIKSLSDGDFKHRRHALRLAINLWDLRRYGVFNPTLTTTQIACINEWAKSENVLELAEDIAWQI